MKFKWLDSLLQLSDNPPTVIHQNGDENISLDFKNIYHIQEFLLGIRRQGVMHGIALEQLRERSKNG